MSLYEQDFHAWANEQADAVRRRSWNELDWENVAEELESLGRQQRAELRNRYVILLTHLLKWTAQTQLRGSSWRKTIRVQRKDLRRHLRDNPSLQHDDAELFAEAYENARLLASAQTGLDEDRFAAKAPFTPEQAMDEDFWPEDD